MSRVGYSFAIAMVGLQATLVRIEANLGQGLPAFNLVGLPDSSVREAKARVEAAFSNGHIKWPLCRITVNLSPADLPKSGTGFDLAISMALLCARYPALQDKVAKIIFCSELGLDGSLRRVKDVFAQVIGARSHGFSTVMVSEDARAQASVVPEIEVLTARNLPHAVLQLARNQPRLLEAIFKESDIAALSAQYVSTTPSSALETEMEDPENSALEAEFSLVDLNEVRGLPQAKEALIVAAAGGHNIFLLGAPGAGKTMLARCLPGLLPPLSFEQALELGSIYSLAGKMKDAGLLPTHAAFLAPHHTSSLSSLVGGGSGIAMPGAISLAHNGVLFLDEAPEFSPHVLNALRQPLEEGRVTLHRSKAIATYPASFQLVLAANPCPCGLALEASGCTCSSLQTTRYLGRVSGALLDRIDIQVRVPRPRLYELKHTASTSTNTARERVIAARTLTRQLWPDTDCNSRVPVKELRSALPSSLADALDSLVCEKGISMRTSARLSRLCFTVAHLEGRLLPQLEDLYSAFSLRFEKAA